ncbi:MAG: cell division protein FtsA [Solobacterium sp.]|nr:cell division protein FtsA [Solobacterium sp.]
MSDKQIFAALEAVDHEVRLIVGEFFNTRFNIIKVERTPIEGFTGGVITDPEAVVKGIKTAAHDAAKMIGADIEKVIVAMPSFGMKRYSVKSTVPVTGIDGAVTVEDIREAVRKAQSINIGKDLALIQTVCVKYTVNGITSRRIPTGEKANALTVDIDLLCADRQLSFDIVTCVEQAGLQVIDIFPDVFAVAKEAALFEQAVDQNVIVLKMERSSTTLGLLSKGRLTTCIVEPQGVGTIGKAVEEKYGLNSDVCAELVKYSARLNEKVNSTNPVYIWADADGGTQKINEQQLCDCIRGNVEKWLNDMQKLCQPILQAGPTAVIITGEGGEMQGLKDLLQKKLGCEVRNYIPDTLGGRNAGLTACLGLFYAFKDKQPITGFTENSLDMDAFMDAVSYRGRETTGNPEDTITKKLKGILFDGKK